MVVFVYPDLVPSNKLLKWLCHADIDILEDIEKRYSEVKENSVRVNMRNKFSLVLDDLFINGSWKRTMQGRLHKSELLLCEHIKKHNNSYEISFLDIGCSDGITTLDMINKMNDYGLYPKYILLMDLNIKLIKYKSGPIMEYRTSRGEPVFLKMGLLGLRLPCSPRRFDIISTLLARNYIRMTWLRKRLKYYGEISLINPAVKALAGINIYEDNIIQENYDLYNSFDAIRCCNVMNVGAFNEKDIIKCISIINNYLKEGGFLVLSRNDIHGNNEIENGSAWRKKGHYFEHLSDIGTGFEYNNLINEAFCK